LRQGLELYRKLLEVGRVDRQLVVRTHMCMAEILLQMGDMHRAETHLLELVAIDPGNAYGLHLLSWTYAEMRQWVKAAQRARSACQLEPGISEYHQILGRALLCTGDWTNGCDALERAIEADPDNIVAICDLAMADAQQGRVARAQRSLRRAIARHRTDALLRDTLAAVQRIQHELSGRAVKSRDRARGEQSQKISDLSRQVCETLADSLTRKGYLKGAIDSAIRLCLDFDQVRGLGQSNPMVMAAACEYTIGRLMGVAGVTQTAAAEQYGVSPAAVSNKYRAMVQALRLTDDDTRYISDGMRDGTGRPADM